MGLAAKVSIGLLVAIVVVFLFYVYLHMSYKSKFASGDGNCGGKDALCSCNGNECMTATRVSEDKLTAVMQGAVNI